jgi:hypothetical protein
LKLVGSCAEGLVKSDEANKQAWITTGKVFFFLRWLIPLLYSPEFLSREISGKFKKCKRKINLYVLSSFLLLQPTTMMMMMVQWSFVWIGVLLSVLASIAAGSPVRLQDVAYTIILLVFQAGANANLTAAASAATQTSLQRKQQELLVAAQIAVDDINGGKYAMLDNDPLPGYTLQLAPIDTLSDSAHTTWAVAYDLIYGAAKVLEQLLVIRNQCNLTVWTQTADDISFSGLIQPSTFVSDMYTDGEDAGGNQDAANYQYKFTQPLVPFQFPTVCLLPTISSRPRTCSLTTLSQPLCDTPDGGRGELMRCAITSLCLWWISSLC